MTDIREAAAAFAEKYPQYRSKMRMARPLQFKRNTGKPGVRWWSKGDITVGYLDMAKRLHAFSQRSYTYGTRTIDASGWCVVTNPEGKIQWLSE